ncbi:MAG: hypothetical protein M9894_04270 [Planctomycetes bacterium]|nr:hypothetical protein [Planctomycetota bacterium]
MAPPPDERPYTLDDLVSHEKRQMRLVLLVLVLAMVYFAGRRVLDLDVREPEGPAPVSSPAGG